LPGPHAAESETVVGDYALFAGGNVGQQGQASDVVDVYDAATGVWSRAHLSQAREGVQVATVGNLAIFAGGQTANEAAPSAAVDVFDASSGRWFTADPLFAGRAVAKVVSAGGKAPFVGGQFTDPKSLETRYWDTIDAYAVGPLAGVGGTTQVSGSMTAVKGGRVTVTLTAAGGDAPLRVGATVSIYAGTGATVTSSSVLLGKATVPHDVLAGESVTLKVRVRSHRPRRARTLVAAFEDRNAPGETVFASRSGRNP
jgi:hypothetical protein